MKVFFPYETVRPSQKELIESIQENLKGKRNLIAHAPTGLGKTAAVLSSILPFALEKNLTIFFVTPKHTQHRIAIETLQIIKQKFKKEFIALDIIGKKHLCAQEGAEALSQFEFSEYCRSLVENGNCDFFNKIKQKQKLSTEAELFLKQVKENIVHVEDLKKLAQQAKLCPFEMACLLGREASVIVADYHHLLNSGVRDTILSRTEKELSKAILIFDEAHNLPDKARELLTAKLSTYIIEQARKEAISLGQEDIAMDIKGIEHLLLDLAKKHLSIQEAQALIKKEEFLNKISNISLLIKDLLEIAKIIKEDKKRSFAESLAHFLVAWQEAEKGFTRILKREENEQGKSMLSLSYNCLDPSLLIKNIAEESYLSIFMSGTLTPTKMYKDLFGITAEEKEFQNPFPIKNKLNIIIPETTTKFTQRNEEMFQQIASYCSSITNITPGNSIIFFPSYDLKDRVNLYFKTESEKTIFQEARGMSKTEKENMIERFKIYGKQGAVLLATTSGSFGEGIDIKGNIVKGVIVVGLPLAKPDLETQELIKYYEEKFAKGWDYGYTLPALIKTKQNAGRCIRSDTDKGVVVYLDKRYIWGNYFQAFQQEENLAITKNPSEIIKEFFINSVNVRK